LEAGEVLGLRWSDVSRGFAREPALDRQELSSGKGFELLAYRKVLGHRSPS
jgi:hypothetical protein